MGVRRAQDIGAGLARQAHIVDEAAGALQQPLVLEAGERLADAELAHLSASEPLAGRRTTYECCRRASPRRRFHPSPPPFAGRSLSLGITYSNSLRSQVCVSGWTLTVAGHVIRPVMSVHLEAAAHAGEAQPFTVEADARELGEAEAVPPALAAEPREAGVAVLRLDAPEESLECIIQPLERPALEVDWQRAHLGQISATERQYARTGRCSCGLSRSRGSSRSVPQGRRYRADAASRAGARARRAGASTAAGDSGRSKSSSRHREGVMYISPLSLVPSSHHRPVRARTGNHAPTALKPGKTAPSICIKTKPLPTE